MTDQQVDWLITLLVALFGAGGVWAWLSSRKKVNAEAQQIATKIVLDTLDAIKKDNVELRSRIDKLEAQVEALESQRDKLEEENKELRRENVELKVEVAELRCELSQLNARLAKYEAKAAADEVSGLVE